jgi:hypothetical protein
VTIDAGVLAALISAAGAGVLGGLGWILRAITKQNDTLARQNGAMAGQSQALAVLVARVDPTVQKTQTLDTAVAGLTTRVSALELRWQIRDGVAAGQIPAAVAPAQGVTVNA